MQWMHTGADVTQPPSLPASQPPSLPASQPPSLPASQPSSASPRDAATTLDAVLTKSILESAAGTYGSIPFERLRAAIEERIGLSPNRGRNWFHAGLFDAFDRADADLARAPAESSARGWYVAGVISALTERGGSPAIVGHFDRHRSDLCPLIDGRHDACAEAAKAIFRAFCAEDRHAEIFALLVPLAVCRGGSPFFDELLYEAGPFVAEASPIDADVETSLLESAVALFELSDAPLPVDLSSASGLGDVLAGGRRARPHRLPPALVVESSTVRE